MKIKELRGLSREELLQKEKSLRDELFKLNLQRYSKNVEKPHLFLQRRKDIARIKTLLNPIRNASKVNSHISNGVNEKKAKQNA